METIEGHTVIITVSLIIFFLGFLLGVAFNNFTYSRRLIEKANAPEEYGGSNMIYVNHKPLAIMHEKDYIKYIRIEHPRF